MDTTVAFLKVNAALERCMAAHPPSGGDERRLHRDASLIADIWARMLIERRISLDSADVPENCLEALQRWAVS